MTGKLWANTPGPKPGSLKAISQRKAISEGYAAASTPRRVNLSQSHKDTGGVKVPGWTTKGNEQ